MTRDGEGFEDPSVSLDNNSKISKLLSDPSTME